jgi:hypothetical protein
VSPQASVIVPSHGRPEKLGRLLARLASQRDRDFEVLVALDGGGSAPSAPPGLDVHFLDLPRVGISDAKNHALERARGETLILVNDDVEPEPDFVTEHLRAQASGAPFVLGASPFVNVPDTTLLDVLVARTRMIFFYQGLATGERHDFRHAWNLNLSVRRDRLPTGLAFASRLRPCMFEDLELSHRIIGDRRDVLFHAAARAPHNHRYQLVDYFVREVLMGVMAPELSAVNPACFRSIFGEDLSALEARARRGLETDVRDALRTLPTLIDAARQPCAADAPQLSLDTWYAAHLPLKRRAFRRGLIGALEATTPVDGPRRPGLARELAQSDPVLGGLFD